MTMTFKMNGDEGITK